MFTFLIFNRLLMNHRDNDGVVLKVVLLSTLLLRVWLVGGVVKNSAVGFVNSYLSNN